MAQIVRRITSTPQQRGSLTGQRCPDMFEWGDGPLAISGRFETRPAQQSPGQRGTIDSFLVSLARETDWRTIAVFFPIIGGHWTGRIRAGTVVPWQSCRRAPESSSSRTRSHTWSR